MSPNATNPELLLAHADFVRDLARSLLSDAHAAEDVAQDVLKTALERPPLSTRSLRAWLARVTRNLAYQTHRTANRRRDRERLLEQSEQKSVEEIASREAVRGELVGALLALPEPMRAPILLRYYEGLPPRAIAKRLDLPVETVRTRIKRGLARVRADLASSRTFEGRDLALVLLPLARQGSSAVAGLSSILAGGLQVKAAAGIVLVFLAVLGSRALLRSPAPARNGATQQIASAEDSSAVDDPSVGNDSREALDPFRHAERSLVSTPGKVLVTGKVLDPRGAPVVHAMVYASPSGPIRGELHGPSGEVSSDKGPATFGHSDEKGLFSLEVQRPEQTYVAVAQASDAFLEPGEGRWVEAPASEVVLVVEDTPRAGIVLRATAAASGQLLRDFPVLFHSSLTKTYLERRATGTELRSELPLRKGLTAGDFQVVLELDGFEPWSRMVRLEQGRWTEVEALLQGSGAVRGRVVDAAGNAVEGALVFFGLPMRLRGDEPFKPFVPERVKDGARTGPDGGFELIGSGERLTAWHGDFGASTVALADAREIALPSTGSIRGRLLDRARHPLAGSAVILDRTQSTTTDANGRFAFDRVFAGVRGLQLDLPAPASGTEPSRVARIGVLMKSGESVELELGADWIDGVVELESDGGEPFSGKAVLVGLDGICSFAEILFADGRAEVRDFLPGRYLLTAPHGPMALASIEGPYTKLALGKCDLTASGTPGARAFLVVEGAHELAELLAARISARPIPSSGEIRFEGLPPATWSVGVEGRGLLATIDVSEPGTKVQLP